MNTGKNAAIAPPVTSESLLNNALWLYREGQEMENPFEKMKKYKEALFNIHGIYGMTNMGNYISIRADTIKKEIENKINDTEKDITPEIIFKEGLKHYNEARQMREPKENYGKALFYIETYLFEMPIGYDPFSVGKIIKDIRAKL